MTDPWARPANDEAAPSAESELPLTPAQTPAPAQQGQPVYAQSAEPPPGHAAPATAVLPTQHAAPQEIPATDPSAKKPRGGGIKRFFSDPLSLILIIVIALALAVAGVIGGEAYARNRGDSVVAQAVQCVVQDKVDVSFGARPFLWQVATGHYDNISVSTAGNQIRFAKGMKAQISIDDVKLNKTANSSGTIGALNATVTWSADGIKQTIANTVPVLGGLVSDVSTDPSSGTIQLQAPLTKIVAKPTVVDGGVSLKVLQLSGLGVMLPHESIQPALDAFAAQLTKDYPLNIHVDSVQVTDTGVIAKFSTQNATMPLGTQDACFSGL